MLEPCPAEGDGQQRVHPDTVGRTASREVGFRRHHVVGIQEDGIDEEQDVGNGEDGEDPKGQRGLLKNRPKGSLSGAAAAEDTDAGNESQR